MCRHVSGLQLGEHTREQSGPKYPLVQAGCRKKKTYTDKKTDVKCHLKLFLLDFSILRIIFIDDVRGILNTETK